ncbi:MAG TPA: DUF2304 domain-containing protein [Bacteroidales bacterium]|nr:DUF2304 domain-containing protein [Bacteroidales bacterium]HRZ48289.1 DUF2304 domain-containing protein [Bacteroidales bacterium]
MARMQIIAILFSLGLLAYILRIISRKSLKEEYSLLWLGVSIVFLIFSAWRQGLEMMANLLGVAYAPAALFIILLVGMLLILIQFSMILSQLSDRSRVMAQKYALLKLELETLKEEVARWSDRDKEAGTDLPAPAKESGPGA